MAKGKPYQKGASHYSQKRHFSPKKIGLWETLYKNDRETTYHAWGKETRDKEVNVSR